MASRIAGSVQAPRQFDRGRSCTDTSHSPSSLFLDGGHRETIAVEFSTSDDQRRIDRSRAQRLALKRSNTSSASISTARPGRGGSRSVNANASDAFQGTDRLSTRCLNWVPLGPVVQAGVTRVLRRSYQSHPRDGVIVDLVFGPSIGEDRNAGRSSIQRDVAVQRRGGRDGFAGGCVPDC